MDPSAKIRENLKTLIRVFDVSKGRAKYSTIRDRITAGVRVDGIHLCQLIAAMIIASIGLNTDSTEAIIGAMLICPLMGSVLALAYATATMDMRLLRRALAALVIECGICLVTSTLYFCLSPLQYTTSALLNNTSATIWDVVIALVGGFAGALGMSRRQEPTTLISGVAVATALMPPLCAVGYGLAGGKIVLALSALYEFMINVVFIGFGASVVFLWLRVPLVGDLDGDGKESPGERAEAERESHVLRRYIALALAIFAIPCCHFSTQVIDRQLEASGTLQVAADVYETKEVTQELKAICPGFVSYRVGTEDSYNTRKKAVVEHVVATVVTSEELSAENKKNLTKLIRVHVPDLDSVNFTVAEE